ncbi:DNA polymerase-3 subunit epsilon [Halopolyspora algeriensis]|uniref:DNA polymerase-3 subunit epsilon n=1 Tax=Halopolyspora algeriensis TaxID=1500506 RepID=A0A368VVM9_9ACTN|nr:exonuclease domain-containing protein [Halopolyspora algeriensis]RCW45899.1 DNA polymerase-3 subunit epsilon [Halopolyspora algeriensis]TQM55313.1 DNA polymerase-3 subunit epsilon [Halopolyspora algeriensis]
MTAGYAVVDVETTGFRAGGHDRIVEVAVVQLDPAGTVTGEWCTVVNPQRDLGPQHIHGITAAQARQAPLFADIAAELAAQLAGRVLVAHNLPFDLSFLAAEYARLGLDVPLSTDSGLCTMDLSERYLTATARSLAACCRAAGVALTRAHSALHDARAAAGLLTCFLGRTRPAPPWADLLSRASRTHWPLVPAGTSRVLRRDIAPAPSAPAEIAPTAREVPCPATGDLVAFTGETREPREMWEQRARAAGLAVQGYVTRKTRLVVAADPDSLSVKARKARDYGIPIVTEDAFARLLGRTAPEPA